MFDTPAASNLEAPAAQPAPTIGRVVLFRSPNRDHMGGAAPGDPVPALITRAWGPQCVNLQVMRDSLGPIPVSSVIFVPDIYAADPHTVGPCWGWMPYQKADFAQRQAAGAPT